MLAVVWEELFQFSVEAFLVVEVLEVDGLVDDYVFGEFGWQGGELPVVGEVAFLGAFAPFGGVLYSGFLGEGSEFFFVFLEGVLDQVSGLFCYPFFEDFEGVFFLFDLDSEGFSCDLDSGFCWVGGFSCFDLVGFAAYMDGVSVEEFDLGDCFSVFSGEEVAAFGYAGVEVYFLASGDLYGDLSGVELDVEGSAGVAGLDAYLDFFAVDGDGLHLVGLFLSIHLMNSSLSLVS